MFPPKLQYFTASLSVKTEESNSKYVGYYQNEPEVPLVDGPRKSRPNPAIRGSKLCHVVGSSYTW